MRNRNTIPQLLMGMILLFSSHTVMADKRDPVGITPSIMSVTINVDGKKVEVKRNQDNDNLINPAFSKTSRACPPFCIEPMSIAPNVETIGEIETLDYLKRSSAGEAVMVIDARTPEWMMRGTIPGSVNIPWTTLSVRGADTWEDAATAEEVIVSRFGADMKGEKLDFTHAKTLVLFCNGAWCEQSTANIKLLLAKGYPAEKIKWYRGGMQSWTGFGLSTVYFRK
ncbi:MAG: rhodanese-like domain-containing protein [Cocleimonas sp.]|nr:rhodanese-like domain-containing protein [Cocleimonas sp.]